MGDPFANADIFGSAANAAWLEGAVSPGAKHTNKEDALSMLAAGGVAGGGGGGGDGGGGGPAAFTPGPSPNHRSLRHPLCGRTLWFVSKRLFAELANQSWFVQRF